MSTSSKASDVGRVDDLDRPERLTDAERDDCRGARRAEHVAARVLAKRLAARLLDRPLDTAEDWHAIVIVREPSGQPRLQVDGQPRDDLLVSFSHTAEIASAVVMRTESPL